MSSSQLHKDLIAMVEATRAVERDLFARLKPAVRDAAGPEGGWSPKTIQAHLSDWKARRAMWLATARDGHEFDDNLDDLAIEEVNARLRANRADWSWGAISAEADTVSLELATQLMATPEAILRGPAHLIEGTLANGPYHVIDHLSDMAREHDAGPYLAAYADALARIAVRGGLPDAAAGTLIYNLACRHALGGRPAGARRLLPHAVRLRPDLGELAAHDSDLSALGGDLGFAL